MKKQQLSILLGIMIILIGGIVFAWQKSNQELPQNQTKEEKVVENSDTNQSDTSEWKTYRNEKFGFEIKYPNDWKILENAGDNSNRSVISFTSSETQEMIQGRKTDSSCDLSVYYYPSVADEPENKMNGFKASTIEEMIDKNRMITRIGQTTLGGEQATAVVWGGARAYYSILSDHANHLYIISSCNKERRDALTAIDIIILESFKFLNE